MKTIKINALENNERMSTQSLLQLIESKIEEGYTDKEAKRLVSKKLCHGRGDITQYYINSANK